MIFKLKPLDDHEKGDVVAASYISYEQAAIAIYYINRQQQLYITQINSNNYIPHKQAAITIITYISKYQQIPRYSHIIIIYKTAQP